MKPPDGHRRSPRQSEVGSGKILITEHVSNDVLDSPAWAQGLVVPLIGAELVKEVDEVMTLYVEPSR